MKKIAIISLAVLLLLVFGCTKSTLPDSKQAASSSDSSQSSDLSLGDDILDLGSEEQDLSLTESADDITSSDLEGLDF